MEEKDKRAAMVLGLAALAGLGMALVKKPTPPEEPETPGGDVTITVYDARGNVVPANSPVTLEEGASYSFTFSVRNRATRGGVPWPATYNITYQVIIYGNRLVLNTVSQTFGADQQVNFGPFPFTVPWDMGGRSGAIDVIVEVPATGAIIASGTEMISVVSVQIIYAADVVIGI